MALHGFNPDFTKSIVFGLLLGFFFLDGCKCKSPRKLLETMPMHKLEGANNVYYGQFESGEWSMLAVLRNRKKID